MARPQRNNVDYFPFYCEEGKKMFYLEETYGNDGFAVFVKLLRELAKADYHYLDLSKKTTTMFLSAKCKVSNDILESIIKDLVDLDKFNENLWTENRIIWCQDFIDSIQDAYSKRNNNCMTYDSLLLLLDSLGVRKLSKSNIIGNVNPQSIVENTKEDKKKVNNIPTFQEFLNYSKTLSIYHSSFDFQIEAKYNSWVESGWKDGNNKKIVNWKTKIQNTMPYFRKHFTAENGNNSIPKKVSSKDWDYEK